ncbi:MAG: hypothetical protein PVG61_03555, partial [Dehalococcoidia bacterium]
ILRTLFQDASTITLLVVVIALFAFLMYSREISRAFSRRRNTVQNPDITRDDRGEMTLARRFEFTERALHEFAGAMEIYAEHLASHTSAIRGLSEASHALKGSAAEQNRILGHLSETIIRDRRNREIAMMEGLVGRFEKKTAEALRARDELEGGATEYIIDEIRVKKEAGPPPGCMVNPRAWRTRPHS